LNELNSPGSRRGAGARRAALCDANLRLQPSAQRATPGHQRTNEGIRRKRISRVTSIWPSSDAAITAAAGCGCCSGGCCSRRLRRYPHPSPSQPRGGLGWQHRRHKSLTISHANVILAVGVGLGRLECGPFRDIHRSRRCGDPAPYWGAHHSNERGLIMTQVEQPTVWNRPLDGVGLTSTTG
jgi:hypothetical protein